MTERIDVTQAEFSKILDSYNKKSRDNFTALIYGPFGSGKTQMLTTAKRPIVIDFFDPKGWINSEVKKGIDEGWIFPTDWSCDRLENPRQYANWELRLRSWINSRFLNNVGTYAIDSISTWSRAMMNKIVKAKNRDYGVPAIQDYMVVLNTLIDIIHAMSDQECDFIMTGHMEMEKDEETDGFVSNLALFKSLRRDVPLLFAEKWLLLPQIAGTKVIYKVLTQNTGRHLASTRIGGGVFDMYEKPDIKYLLEKAGWDTSDKGKEVSE